MKKNIAQKKVWKIGIILFVFLLFSLMKVNLYDFFHFPSNNKTSVLSKSEAAAQFLKAPLHFEYNEGQTDANVKYLTKSQGYTTYFTPQEVVMVLQGKSQGKEMAFSVLRMQFVEANHEPIVKGLDKTHYISNYFIGNDPKKWHTNISNYAKVCYQEIYPGIDAIFYGNQERLEYDICVAPGANPQRARLKMDGAKKLSIDQNGNLHIFTDENTDLQMQKPFVYQIIEGNKIIIDGSFILLAQNEVGFSIGTYDPSQCVVIDPVLDYSTYLGGNNSDSGLAIALDNMGNTYITGQTTSTNFPTTTGAFQTALIGNLNAFITKLKPIGGGLSDLLYSTYLGGSNSDTGDGIAIDNSGNVYIIGYTSSIDFPITTGAFQTTLTGSQNAFITKLNPVGGGISDLVYSTYLGGSNFDIGNAIAVDNSSNIYVTGYTTSLNFPVTVGAFQTALTGTRNAFITKLNPVGGGNSDLLYSTYLGGNNTTSGLGIALDNINNAYIAGFTTSTSFPTTIGAFQTAAIGNQNGFITKLNLAGGGLSDLLYSTYLGGSNFDISFAIALDGSNNAYVTGYTESTNFPTTIGAFQTTLVGLQNTFVTKLNLAGGGASDLLYSTYLGGNNSDIGTEVAVDSKGNAYITGYTNSTNFPTTLGAFQTTLTGLQNAFVTKLNPAGEGASDLLYSTYLGGNNSDAGRGVAIDNTGNTYVTGLTNSINFPNTINAFQTELNGIQNAFISKLAIGNPVVSSIAPPNGSTNGGTTVTITGINFTNATAVYFGGIAANFSINSDTQITAISPSHGEGIAYIIVVGAGGSSEENLNSLFTYKVLTSTTTTLFVTPNPSIIGQSVSLTATISPNLATGSIQFFDGGTLIATVPVSNGIASFTTSSFAIGIYTLTAVYSGDANFSGSTSPSFVLTITAASSLSPPMYLQGFQITNRFATQTDLINVLKWEAPIQSSNIVSYRIYSNLSLTKFVAEISANEKLQFKQHNRKKGKNYTYYIVSVDQLGNLSPAAKIKVRKD